MRRATRLAAVLAAAIFAVSAAYATVPVVTIDSAKNFCVDGQPIFPIGTMGGDGSAWYTHLAPAGFNVRFLGTTDTPGAHTVGLWELPDVFSDPSEIAVYKDDPNYLMWDLGYEIDLNVTTFNNWMDYTVDQIKNKRLSCIAYDGANPRPVGTCWGNAKRSYGSELWGWQGYWIAYRQYAPHVDYMVVGDYFWGEKDETVSHAVRMSTKPVIYIVRASPKPDPPSGTDPTPEELQAILWMAAIEGAKGIIIDRFEDAGQTWITSTPFYWEVIRKTCKELRAIDHVFLEPGPHLYYTIGFESCVRYTFRKVGNDLYFIAVNAHPTEPDTVVITVPIPEASAEGEVLFDYLYVGAVMLDPTPTTFTDYTKNWAVDELAGQKLHIKRGSQDLYYRIASNTNDTITIADGDLVADGVQRGDAYEVIEMMTLNKRRIIQYLGPGERKVILFRNVTFSYSMQPTPAAVGTPSNRKWVVLQDYSEQVGTEYCPADAYGLAYDESRHRLVCYGGLANAWPQGKPDPTYPDVTSTSSVWEWDIDTGYYSGRIQDGDQLAGDPWPTESVEYHDMVYDPVRQCTVAYNWELRQVDEWRGVEQGWRCVPNETGDGESPPADISHYAAIYNPSLGRMLFYGGKRWDFPSTAGYYRNWQFAQEWINMAHGYDGTYWYKYGNEANLPLTELQEPVMAWDSARSKAVLFGLSHDGQFSKDTNPERYFQETPQQTYEYSLISCTRKYTAHVPYVYYNYQMAFDPRTNTTLLLGGWPSVNGKGTDLYEYDGTDWTRSLYDDSALPAQDAMRILTMTYDPDHQMIVLLDTRQHRVLGLTSGLETVVGTVNEAKGLPDGTKVVLEGKVVGRNFGPYFYMQEPDRLSGIRVVSNSTAAVEGTVVNVIGTVATLSTGEKQIVAQVVGTSGSTEVRPLALTTKALGGTAGTNTPGVYQGYGVNNIGVVVTVCGEVTYVGTDYIYIDDGANLSDGSGHTGVKVRLNGAAAPSVGDFVTVTGISGIEQISGNNARVLLLSDGSDMIVL